MQQASANALEALRQTKRNTEELKAGQKRMEKTQQETHETTKENQETTKRIEQMLLGMKKKITALGSESLDGLRADKDAVEKARKKDQRRYNRKVNDLKSKNKSRTNKLKDEKASLENQITIFKKKEEKQKEQQNKERARRRAKATANGAKKAKGAKKDEQDDQEKKYVENEKENEENKKEENKTKKKPRWFGSSQGHFCLPVQTAGKHGSDTGVHASLLKQNKQNKNRK